MLRQALTDQPPPLRQNRRPKIYYATQVATNPPTIVLFTNGPELFDNTYQRYLLKTFRDHLPFGDVPIKLYLRDKNREDRVPGAAAGGFVRASRDTAAQEGETNRGQTQAESGRTGPVGSVS